MYYYVGMKSGSGFIDNVRMRVTKSHAHHLLVLKISAAQHHFFRSSQIHQHLKLLEEMDARFAGMLQLY